MEPADGNEVITLKMLNHARGLMGVSIDLRLNRDGTVNSDKSISSKDIFSVSEMTFAFAKFFKGEGFSYSDNWESLGGGDTASFMITNTVKIDNVDFIGRIDYQGRASLKVQRSEDSPITA